MCEGDRNALTCMIHTLNVKPQRLQDDCIYLFGGSDHDPKNDLWRLDLVKGDWQCIQPHIPTDQCGSNVSPCFML